MIPNLFIVGAAKSATTTLYMQLQQHEDIYFPNQKEPKYLSQPYKKKPMKGPGDDISEKNEFKSGKEYFKLYSNRNEKYLGDASVDYLYYYKTAKDIYKLNPNSKIIICLRNPTDRAYSAYWHLRNDEREKFEFKDALELENKRIENNYEFIWHYKNAGLYYKQVKEFLEVFENQNVFIVLQDDLVADLEGTIIKLLKFLDLDFEGFEIDRTRKNPSGEPKSKIINKFVRNRNIFKSIIKPLIPRKFRQRLKSKVLSKNYRKLPMEDTVRSQLNRYFEDDVKNLEKIINRDLTSWYM